MIKLLIGGSPCTHWSIAQTKNRETTADGIGWELFRNYLIAKEKFQPDFFLYENNKSAAQPIKDQISHELGVDIMYINSALVSAQNRQRFYAFNWEVEQPEDRGILLKDILENSLPYRQTTDEKGYCLDANYWKTPGSPETFLEGGHARANRTMVAEPVCLRYERSEEAKRCRKDYEAGKIHHGYHELSELHPRTDGKTNALTTVRSDSMVAEPVRVCNIGKGRQGERIYDSNAKSCAIKANGGGLGGHGQGLYATPVRVGTIENNLQNPAHDSKQYRVYSPDGKSTTLCGQGGGVGAKTGLYAVPTFLVKEATAKGYTEIEAGDCVDLAMPNSKTCRGRNMKEKCNCLTTGNQFYQYCGTIDKPIYEVNNGLITIKGKQYPIKLADGYYIIRKLTPIECERLQTMPDNYTAAVSNAQRYKGLGNGWTAEVIIHILSGALKDVPKDEKIVVLSMYDGIGTGRYCLDKMGFTNVEYHAYEIDKYAMKIAMSNYPDIIQHGDAFAVRDDGWHV